MPTVRIRVHAVGALLLSPALIHFLLRDEKNVLSYYPGKFDNLNYYGKYDIRSVAVLPVIPGYFPHRK